MSSPLKSMLQAGLTVILMAISSVALAQEAQPAAPAVAREYRPGGYPETYGGGVFYPGAELRALPGARAAAVAARAELSRAQTSMNIAISDVRRTFTRSAAFKEAQAEEKAAWDQLKIAREEALTDLKRDETYQAALELRERLRDQITSHRDEKVIRPQHLLALATVKLSYAATTSAMEAAAVSADPQVQVARQRLVDAGKRMTELNEQFDDAVRTNPAALAARQAIEDAKVAVVATDAAYFEAAKVANVAMDYAYNLYGRPYPYVINSPYSPYGYGYGYGYNSTFVGYPIGYPVGHPWGLPGRDRQR